MAKSPIKIIDSGNVPTTKNLGEGQIAFGTVDGETKLYGSDGTTVSELGGGGGGSEVNSIVPLKVNTAPTTDAGTVANVAVGEQATATLGDLSGLSEELLAQLEAMIEQAGGACNTSIGVRAAATGLMCMAIGGGAQAGENLHEVNTSDMMGGGYGSIALGPDTRAPEVGAISVGMSAHAKSPGAIAIGLGSKAEVHPTHANMENGSVAIGASASAPEPYSVAIGAKSVATDSYVFSVGGMGLTRRIVSVSDPVFDEDAATKKYVDTQLDPINTKLQYVPENTNQILSQIQTNVEKAQSAADAKVASITAGTGISVDASNPTTPIVSTTGLATQASVDTLTSTVNSKADQADLDSLESTVATNTNNITSLQGSVSDLDSSKQDKLANNSITTNLIANDAVTSDKLASNAIQAVFDAIYPIGIIIAGTKPGLGTWEKIQGRFLWASNSAHPAGSTGGSETVKLTADQMPSHSHTVYRGSGSFVTVDDGAPATFGMAGGSFVKLSWGPNSGKYTGSTGGTQAHNNMPPYLSVDMWKRTA